MSPFALIVTTATLTALATVIGLNFVSGEKKIERVIKQHYGVADPQFLRSVGVLLGPAMVPGNAVTTLSNGDEIFPAMLDAIRGADTSITFETFIYWTGDVGKAFADALSERARAGVRVQVLLDWVGSLKMDDAYLQVA